MNGKKLVVSLVGVVVVMALMIFVVAPVAQHQLYTFGANTQIKPEKRCDQYKEEYVEMMVKKLNMSPLIEKAKKDKCLK